LPSLRPRRPQAHLSRTRDEFALPIGCYPADFQEATRRAKANGRARLAEPKTQERRRLICPARGGNSPYLLGVMRPISRKPRGVLRQMVGRGSPSLRPENVAGSFVPHAGRIRPTILGVMRPISPKQQSHGKPIGRARLAETRKRRRLIGPFACRIRPTAISDYPRKLLKGGR
jgi:hypothetical protein